CRVLFRGWRHSREWHWPGFGSCHPSTFPALTMLCRTPQIVFVSLQAQEIPSVHQVKTGASYMATLPECRSMLEKLVKWQQPGIRFLSKMSLLKMIGLCGQNGRNGRPFEVSRAIPSSFGTNCLGLSPFSAGTHSVRKSSVG